MNRVIIITGVTSGIGAKLKELFLADGDIVIGLARSVEDSEFNYSLDVSNHEDVKNTFEKIGQKYPKVDMLINSAGFGQFGAVELLTETEIKKQFDVNVFGLIWCNQSVLPLMNRGSKIINISSASAFFALPFRSLYSASKAAVNQISFGLYMELKDAGIQVTSICPGDIKTNFNKNRQANLTTNSRYSDRIEKSFTHIQERAEKRMSNDYASKCIYNICNKKKLKPLYIVGKSYKFLNFCDHIFSKKAILDVTNKRF
ncbi:MAG: SDR family NAD(P)-dependent oxidoreductase [Clostridia bacterium]|nr:SDR family NAD(P)-dependent oxidoreductase [Clostridia bacterium]